MTLKYCEWVKHSYELNKFDNVFTYNEKEDKCEIIVHPASEKVILNINEDVISQVYAYPKSTQLYFFGFIWLGFVNSATNVEYEACIQIMHSVFNYAKENPAVKKTEMIWDDHAISERICLLVSKLEDKVFNTIGAEIDAHIAQCADVLNEMLASDKWIGNNHRAFHLCAKLCLDLKYFESESSSKKTIADLKEFFYNLMDPTTGLSVEQSVSYYNFDIYLLESIVEYLSNIKAPIDDPLFIKGYLRDLKDLHLNALAFPDGKLPASGDTPLGLQIKKDINPNIRNIECWTNLTKMGHYRGSSDNGRFHYHILDHNSESAHGHFSPLHIDLWHRNLGEVLIDSGGPYKYGDKLRYSWFQTAKAHNTIFFENSSLKTAKITIKSSSDFSTLSGSLVLKDSVFKRKVFSNENNFFVCDEIKSNEPWTLTYRFHPDIEVIKLTKYVYALRNGSAALLFKIKSTEMNIISEQAYYTIRGGHKDLSESIVFKGERGYSELGVEIIEI